MTFFDLIVLSLVGASLIAGALRGFVRALIATVAMFVGVIIAAQGYETVGTALRALGLVEAKATANACGFLLLVSFALALGFLAGGLLRGRLRRAKLEWMDRALGAVFGLVRGMAVCSVVYLALTAFPVRIDSVEEARTRFQSEYRRLTG
jgi:membrane protein required for colicin V production